MTNNKNNFKMSDIVDEEYFAEIGNSIKKSVNATLKKFAKMTETKDNLPQIRNKEVCAQKPPELSKARGFQVLSYFLGFGFLAAFIVFTDLFLDYRGFFYFLMTILSLGLTVVTPYISRKISKEYLRLTNNYIRFLRELGNNTVISIWDLASAVAQSEEKTVSDLTKMMKRGYFYQARIVENDSLFILDIPTFRLYKDKRNEIPIAKKESEKVDDDVLVEDLSSQRAEEIISSGKAFLDNINGNKIRILDDSFKKRVDKLLKSSTDILNLVEKYPEKSYALNKFSDYYLPTTAKLVDTYYDFELMRTDDKKIKKSMNQISESIVTISEAFEKIKVELLSDQAMDIKTDIDTINLLLKQEGYADDDWRNE